MLISILFVGLSHALCFTYRNANKSANISDEVCAAQVLDQTNATGVSRWLSKLNAGVCTVVVVMGSSNTCGVNHCPTRYRSEEIPCPRLQGGFTCRPEAWPALLEPMLNAAYPCQEGGDGTKQHRIVNLCQPGYGSDGISTNIASCMLDKYKTRSRNSSYLSYLFKRFRKFNNSIRVLTRSKWKQRIVCGMMQSADVFLVEPQLIDNTQILEQPRKKTQIRGNVEIIARRVLGSEKSLAFVNGGYRSDAPDPKGVVDLHRGVLQRYQVPYVDLLRSPEVGWRLLGNESSVVPGLDDYCDPGHPTRFGHTFLARGIMYAIKMWRSHNLSAVPNTMPAPMMPMADDGLRATMHSMADGPKTVELFRNISGWSLYEDVPRKPGWIANTTGSYFTLPLHTPPDMVGVGYLTSYRSMGTLRVRGICEVNNSQKVLAEITIDTLCNDTISVDDQRTLQTESMKGGRGERCFVDFTVIPSADARNTSWNKIKLLFITLWHRIE